MRFMMLVKSSEKTCHPPQALMDAIAKATEEAARAGTMLGGGGLGPTALGARVRLSNGKITVIDGPFMTASGTIGMKTATASPLPTPRSRKPAAT